MNLHNQFSRCIALAVLALAGCSSIESLWPRSRITVEIGDVVAHVEVAKTVSERQKGLMHRTSLGPDQGMLFVFETEKTQSFWMKNTLIPLDVGFFDSDGFLVDIQQMIPDDGRRMYVSTAPAKYAIEMPANWFAVNNVRRFARLKLPQPVEAE